MFGLSMKRIKEKQSSSRIHTRSLADRSKDLAPITIGYDPLLTQLFSEEHAKIHSTLSSILVLNKQRNFIDSRHQMTIFTNLFVSHITKKQARLYTFLESEFKQIDIIGPAIRAYRSKMNSINRMVREFLTIWVNRDISVSVKEFSLDVVRIKKALVESNKQEENEVFKYYDNHKKMLENGMKNSYMLNIVNNNSSASEFVIPGEPNITSDHFEMSGSNNKDTLELSANG